MKPTQANGIPRTMMHRVEADGVAVVYREAGAPDAPVALLPRGCVSLSIPPARSSQYAEGMPHPKGSIPARSRGC